ncbi:MAG TPA: hypothetical protein VHA77_13240 [Xanthobacteraceae bacterium]|nr:hypothetical protein [Xanthobacteraceae bacterium]HVZ20408.1 hypothetical protein [Vicinamibacterales bacterium]
MTDFRIEPELAVHDGPRLTSVAAATTFVREMVDRRSFAPWKDLLRRLEAVRTEEDAVEAAGALRELLQTEQMLAPEKGRQHSRRPVNDFPLVPEIHVSGEPERIIRSTEEAALFVRELITQNPRPDWAAVLDLLESARSEDDANTAGARVRALLESEHLLAH